MSGDEAAANNAAPQTTLDDLRRIPINELVPASGPLSAYKILDLLQPPLVAAQTAEDEALVNALRVMHAICGFHFNPADKGEPYGPIGRLGNKRTPIPSDFNATTFSYISEFARLVTNHALRARLSDVAWLMNPKDHPSAIVAIEAFCDLVEEIVARNAGGDSEDIHARRWSCPNLLRRALDIGRRVGWDRSEVNRAKALLQQLRALANTSGDEALFRLAVELDLHQGVSDPAQIGREIQYHAVAQDAQGNSLAAQNYWRLAESAFSEAKLSEEAARCLIEMSESCYRDAVKNGGSTFAKTHSLTQAIQALRQVPRKLRPAQRLQDLQMELVQAQASIGDEMGEFELTHDLSDLIDDVKLQFADKPLSECIYRLAKIDLHRPYSYYIDEARKRAEESPLASLFGASIHDEEGKVVATANAPSGDDGNEESLRVSIAQYMSLGYNLSVSSGIEPARFIVSQQYHITAEMMLPLCRKSPFVPTGHEGIYALGLAKFFTGANIEAASVLIPQLENSLRYVLKQSGVDVSIIAPNMSQEDVGFSVLLGRLRPDLEAIFGEEIIFKIEMLFHERVGPNLRNRLAHGTWRTGHFWTSEAVYGCWLIFQLVCAPLLSDWASVAKAVFGDDVAEDGV